MLTIRPQNEGHTDMETHPPEQNQTDMNQIERDWTMETKFKSFNPPYIIRSFCVLNSVTFISSESYNSELSDDRQGTHVDVLDRGLSDIPK